MIFSNSFRKSSTYPWSYDIPDDGKPNDEFWVSKIYRFISMRMCRWLIWWMFFDFYDKPLNLRECNGILLHYNNICYVSFSFGSELAGRFNTFRCFPYAHFLGQNLAMKSTSCVCTLCKESNTLNNYMISFVKWAV